MKFKICYTIDSYNDFYIIEADTLDEIISKNANQMKHRGLDVDKNNCYSLRIE